MGGEYGESAADACAGACAAAAGTYQALRYGRSSAVATTATSVPGGKCEDFAGLGF